jgi:hypothetical protein
MLANLSDISTMSFFFNGQPIKFKCQVSVYFVFDLIVVSTSPNLVNLIIVDCVWYFSKC